MSSEEPVDSVDPHAYRSGTRGALFEMAKGTCYFPTCPVETTVFVLPGHPSINVQIAHIEGAERGSARYREKMTNEERRAFPNLLLLCIPHHDLIDNKEPENYPVELLKEWKATRETATGADLIELNSITEESLAALIEAAFKSTRPTREIKLELSSGTFVENKAGLMKLPLGSYPKIVGTIGPDDKCVAITVRNTGELPVSVEAISMLHTIAGNDSEGNLTGRDDYPRHNAPLPCTIPSGESKTWMTSIATFEMIKRAFEATGNTMTHFRYQVALGSGEVESTEQYEIAALFPED